MNVFGHKIYYGWVLVAVAFVAGAFSTGPVIWGVSVFVTPMSDWSVLTLPVGSGGDDSLRNF